MLLVLIALLYERAFIPVVPITTTVVFTDKV